MAKRLMGPYADGSYREVVFGEGGPSPRPVCPKCLDNGVDWRSPEDPSFTYCDCVKGQERQALENPDP